MLSHFILGTLKAPVSIMFGNTVSLHVNFDIDSCSLLITSGSSFEGVSCEAVRLKLEINKSKPLYSGSFYRTPSNDDPDVINKLHESISKLTCKDTVLPNMILRVAIKSLLNAISTPFAPSLLSFILTISYPEFSGKIAESLMVLSNFKMC
jgi:hypothetical protein